MGRRDVGDPEFPRSLEDVQRICDRMVDALRRHPGDRLVCVLLCGSWARGEAHPPESDIDLTVIVDTVDDLAIEALRRAWDQTGFRYAIVYGRDEAAILSRDRREQYTTNAVVLWGSNPLEPPPRQDFARHLAMKAEDLARCARHVLIYPWMTSGRKVQLVRGALEDDMPYALRYLAAFRTGAFPRTAEDTRRKLQGSSEEPLLQWCDGLADEELNLRVDEIARRLNQLGHSWYEEIAPVIADQSGQNAPAVDSPSSRMGCDSGEAL
jgi:hypothetical protein